MKIKLTKKQTLILDFINSFTDVKGFSPSYREIMTGVGLSSVSSVAEHIDNLVKKGAIRKVPGAARSLEVIDLNFPETTMLFQHTIETANEHDAQILREAAEILGIEIEETTNG